MPQIITIGEILVEVMAKEVGQTFLTPGLWQAPYPSGAPAIFISQAARFGAKTGMIGCVGNDDFGRLNINRLQADGVDVSHIAVTDKLPTGCAFVTYKDDGSRSFIYHIPNSAAGLVSDEQVSERWLQNCKYLHVMGSSFAIPGVYQAVMKAASIIKQYDGKVSFDPNVRPELLEKNPSMHKQIMSVLTMTDLLLPGLEELPVLTGENDLERSLETIFATTVVQEAVIKMAAKGCLYISRDERFFVEPFSVEEVDPTGAGDCFGGALVAGFVQGLSRHQAVTLAAAAGALAVTQKGPMEGASYLDKVRQLAASRF